MHHDVSFTCLFHYLIFWIKFYSSSVAVTPMYHTVQLKNSVWVFMYLSVHILCMNDCTLPIHLNSILHITSTLIWAIKCAVCLCTISFLTAIDRYANLSMNFIHVATTTKRILLLSPKDDQPSTMTAIDGNVLLLIFTHLLSSIKLL